MHTCSTLDALVTNREGVGVELFFKCETFQKGGAFKFRGAINSILSLTDEDAKRGVVTHSSGNHAGALALAAKVKGVPSYIVVPEVGLGEKYLRLQYVPSLSSRAGITILPPTLVYITYKNFCTNILFGGWVLPPFHFMFTSCKR